MKLPADDFILLSLVNTKLRDEYPSLSELCAAENVEAAALEARLAALGYAYDGEKNAFITR